MSLNLSSKIISIMGLVLLVTLIVFQQASSNGNKLILLKSKENTTYNLKLKYYVSSDDYKDNQWKSIHPQKVTLVENKKEVEFKPIDHDSLYASGNYYEAVWSPDNNYLVLPLGLFDGFVIYSSKDAWNNIEGEFYPKTIKMRLSADGPALTQAFKGWEGDHTFLFVAGLSGEESTYRYDLKTGELKGDPSFEAVITNTNVVVIKVVK